MNTLLASILDCISPVAKIGVASRRRRDSQWRRQSSSPIPNPRPINISPHFSHACQSVLSLSSFSIRHRFSRPRTTVLYVRRLLRRPFYCIGNQTISRYSRCSPRLLSTMFVRDRADGRLTLFRFARETTGMIARSVRNLRPRNLICTI